MRATIPLTRPITGSGPSRCAGVARAAGLRVAPWRRVPALFPRWTNTPYWIAIAMLGAIVVGVVVAPMIYVRTPYGTSQFTPVVQPVEFDHRHHVARRRDRLPLLPPERRARRRTPGSRRPRSAWAVTARSGRTARSSRWSGRAGTPASRSAGSGSTTFPDHVYFHHGVHVSAGIAVRALPRPTSRRWRASSASPPLTMGWCLDCHRDPPGPAGPRPPHHPAHHLQRVSPLGPHEPRRANRSPRSAVTRIEITRREALQLFGAERRRCSRPAASSAPARRSVRP